MQEELIARFPADVEGIKRFFHELETMIDAMRFPNRAANRSLPERPAKTSARDYLRGLITDWQLRRFLGSLGTREAYAGLPLLAATWNHMCEEGIWYPQGGMRSFCTRLGQAVAGWLWDFEDNSDYHPHWWDPPFSGSIWPGTGPTRPFSWGVHSHGQRPKGGRGVIARCRALEEIRIPGVTAL
jgi:hypothetical protein